MAHAPPPSEADVRQAAKLVGADEEAIVASATELLENRKMYERMSRVHNPYGDGRASIRIADAIHSFFDEKYVAEPAPFQARQT